MSDLITVNIQEADKITCNIINGEVNTASSAGSGTSIFYQKNVYDLEFNAVKSENNKLTVELDAVTHDVEFTLNEGNIDHNSLTNTHNLTTDIDHNSLTNYVLGQHRIINDAGTSATELWSASKIDTAIGSISSSSISTAGTGMYTAEEAQILVGHSENTGTDYIMKLYEGTGTPVPVLQVDGEGNLFNNSLFQLVKKDTSSVFIATSSTHAATSGTNTESIFAGYLSGTALTTGDNNTGYGSRTLATLSTGANDTAVGKRAGFLNNTGSFDAYFGASSGLRHLGSGCVFLGYSSAQWQTSSSNKLFIDNQDRGNSGTEDTDCLITGDFHATANLQKVRINAKFSVNGAALTNQVAGDALLEGGSLILKEITTPTADANYGKIYTKSDNNLYFQDGAGAEHQIDFV